MALIIACIVLAALAAFVAVAAALLGRPLFVPCLAVGVALAAAVAGALLTLNHLAVEPVRAPTAVTETRA
ncbi:hypothetical protein [Streptosporangium sp. V21-05]|uniref:hypothetical protein n=1 Tax=Streptosporangium sp. V21-05 TaxID=3446115 RepID=UPI003F52C95D